MKTIENMKIQRFHLETLTCPSCITRIEGAQVNVLKGRGIEVNLGGKELYSGNKKGLVENAIPLEKTVDSTYHSNCRCWNCNGSSRN